MLSKSRCLQSLCAAGLIALASQATAFAQDGAPTPGDQPAPVTPPPPAATPPASGETYTETTTQRTVQAPEPDAQTNVNVYPSPSTTPNRYVDTAADDYSYPNRRMLGSAAALLTISYLPSVIVAAAGDRENDETLYIPFAGPWMYLAREGHSPGGKALLAIDGVLQDLGGLELLLAFVIPQQEKRRWYELGKNDVRVLPRVSPYHAGLAAGGRF